MSAGDDYVLITLASLALPDQYIRGVNLESYEQEPIYAEDHFLPTGYKIKATGSGYIKLPIAGGDRYNNIASSLANYTGRADSVEMKFDILSGNQFVKISGAEFATTTPGPTTNNTASDIEHGPFVTIRMTQVVGAQVALVSFEINATVGSTTINNFGMIVSHRWKQTMRLDATGKTTRDIMGSIRVIRAAQYKANTAPATGPAFNDYKQRASYPDLFRMAIIPRCSGYGWRRESQEYATDESGLGLVYHITDKLYAHDLPDGCRVGDMNSRYERIGGDASGSARLFFSADLEGDAGLQQGTGNRVLIDAAIQLSKTRINLSGGYKNVRLDRLSIEERQMLSGFAVRLEMDATVFSQDSSASSAIVPLAYTVGQKFTINRTTPADVNQYGPYQLETYNAGTYRAYGMVPHWVDNWITAGGQLQASSTMPQASMFTFTGTNPSEGSISVVVTTAASPGAINELFTGAFQSTLQQPANDGNGYMTLVHQTSAVTNAKYDSGIVRLSPMYVNEPDLTFQTRKPQVVLNEHIEIIRMNQAPAKVQRPIPAGFYLLDDNWKVSFGQFDAQGNRVFTGIYTRQLAGYDTGGGTTSAGFYDFTAPGGETLRAWAAPNSTLLPALVPTASSGSQESTSTAIQTATDTRQAYSVPAQDFIA